MKQSLRLNIMLLATLLMCVFLSTLLIGQNLFLKRVQEDDLQRSSRWQIKILSQSVSQAIWDINDGAVRRVVSDVVKHREIRRIKITDAVGRVIADELNEPAIKDQEPYFEISEPIMHLLQDGHKQAIGDVTISFSREDSLFLLAKFTRTLIFGSVLIMVVYLLCFFYFSRQIFKPVVAITQSMLQLADGVRHVQIPYQERFDEIGSMSRALQTFKDHAVSIDTLRAEIKERSRIQTELEEAMVKADSASRAKTKFLANMSHEIRTPLNGVLATTELLEQTMLNEKQNLYVSIVKQSGGLLLSILNDILDLSKIEAHRLELNWGPFNLRKAIETPLNILRPAAKQKNLDLRYQIDASVPDWVMGDRYRLKQVITNLIGNAVKYTKEGFIQISASTHEINGELRLRFEVQDSGIGIPHEALSTIFDTFMQAHKLEAVNGTGLGLSICKSLITLMKGEIGVESEVGKGSVFWFEIPLIETEAVADKPILENLRDQACSGCHILLAEDYEINRIVIADMLGVLGANVDVALNGEDVLRLCAAKRYDMVFMDCDMPIMDGMEATRQLRKLYGPQMPIVAISAHAFTQEVQECFEAGMNDFVHKPVKMQELSDAIRKWSGKNATEVTGSVSPLKTELAPPVVDIDTEVVESWMLKRGGRGLTFIALTLKDGEILKDQIFSAAASLDYDLIAKAAHALKSVAGQAGGVAVSVLCKDIEAACKAKAEATLLAQLHNLSMKYGEFKAYLQKEQAQAADSVMGEGPPK